MKSLVPILLSWESAAWLVRLGAGRSRAGTISIRQQQPEPAKKAIFLLGPALITAKFPLLGFQTTGFPRSAISLVPLCLKVSWQGSPVLPFPVYGHRQTYFLQTRRFIFFNSLPLLAKYNAYQCWGTQRRLSFSSWPTRGSDTQGYIPLPLLWQSPSCLPCSNKPPSPSLPCKIQVFPPQLNLSLQESTCKL